MTRAIAETDQVAATVEKTKLEEAQRGRARELRDSVATHQPTLFEYEPASGQWLYKHAE